MVREVPTNMGKVGTTIGYYTDQREFSNSLTASSRLQSRVVFDLDTMAFKVIHSTSGTTEVDLDTGEILRWKEADLSDCGNDALLQVDMSLIDKLVLAEWPHEPNWDDAVTQMDFQAKIVTAAARCEGRGDRGTGETNRG